MGNIKYRIEDLQEIASEVGATVLTEKYLGCRQRISFRCACGNEHEALAQNLLYRKQVFRCKACGVAWLQDNPSKCKYPTKASLLSFFSPHGAEPLSEGVRTVFDKVPFKCRCGNFHEVVLHNLETDQAQVPRCPACTLAARPRGEKHPGYLPHLTDADRAAWKSRPQEIKAWYRAVLRLHDYTCVITGQRGGRKAAHHLFNYADYPDLRFDTDNGACISKELHGEFHSIYGYGKNTLSQFKEFFLMKTGRQFERPALEQKVQP